MIKKLVTVTTCMALVLCLCGCGAKKSGEQQSSSKEVATVNIGDTMNATTKNGDISVVVEGFDDSSKMTETYTEYGQCPEGKRIGILKTVVTNVSYEDKYNSGMKLDSDILAKDSDGITMNMLSGAYDYGEYDGCAGGRVQCGQGESVRAAFYYVIPAELEHVTVVVGNSQVDVPVTVA